MATTNKADPKPKLGVAVLLRHHNELLLMLRDDEPRLAANQSPLSWNVFAGGLEPGETAEQALERELLEELGFSIPANELQFIGIQTLTKVVGANDWYIGDLSEGQVAMIQRGEGCGHGFFAFSGLQGLAKVEGKGGLAGAIRRFMLNAPEQIEEFLRDGQAPDLTKMTGAS
jgi:8-oxo-dGTP pyrophosphatase MutT (NUDIX family)